MSEQKIFKNVTTFKVNCPECDMCYDAAYLISRQIRTAKHLGASKRDISELEKQLKLVVKERGFETAKNQLSKEKESIHDELKGEEIQWPAFYHVNGFAHPPTVIYTWGQPLKTEVAEWGFIPFWVKTESEATDPRKPYNNNLNVQSATMFEKKGFVAAAKHGRCVMLLDAYYEHHNYKSKTYPFRIYKKDNEPLYVAGIYNKNTLVDEDTGEEIVKNTIAVLTCSANPMLAKIHNNPAMVKRTGHRMLVILDQEQIGDFLQPYPEAKGLDPAEEKIFQQSILQLCQPYEEEKLAFETVRNLRQRKDMDYIGNVPEIAMPYVWDKLDYAQFE